MDRWLMLAEMGVQREGPEWSDSEEPARQVRQRVGEAALRWRRPRGRVWWDGNARRRRRVESYGCNGDNAYGQEGEQGVHTVERPR